MVFASKKYAEGDGATVNRIIGSKVMTNLDPFLMLDLFNVKLPAGFPDHPHRGFETVTYMIEGEICHEDFKGHKGTIGPGDLQWMTAGKGIVHAEMPTSFEQSSIGFQLWINLDAKNQFCVPNYQEFKSENIPKYKDHEKTVTVISGDVLGVSGPIVARTPTILLDFAFVAEGITYEHEIPADWNCIAVCFAGKVRIMDEETLQPVQIAQLDRIPTP